GEATRFAALSRAAEQVAQGLIPTFTPDIVHAHDWQAGLAPAYLALSGGKRPRTVMTIHNLAFQGQCGAELLGHLGLPPEAYGVDGVEYYGGIGFLKAGIFYADHVTTVSPSYAREIQTPHAGMGLDGLLTTKASEGALSGILNGIDTVVWDPSGDPHLAAPYSRKNLAAKARNKAALQQRMSLDVDPARPLFCVISRLTWQKGMDLLVEALPQLLVRGGQLALLGNGDSFIQNRLQAMATADPSAIGCVFGFDEPLAHLMQGGADAILIPSRFEPCGLTQLYALRYGTIPVVSRLGGLADTVIDANDAALQAGVATGVQFTEVNLQGLVQAIDRTIKLCGDQETWTAMQQCGMSGALSWQRPAGQYQALYHRLLGGEI
ncbi:MAG: glycogen synthase GlgA, partial [Pseudomonadota bacterium]